MNYMAIVVAAILKVALGTIWYSPILFAKPWSKAMGMKQEEFAKHCNKMGVEKYIFPLVSGLVTAFILAWLIQQMQISTLYDGAKLGLIAWLGFTTTVQIMNSWIYSGGRPKELYLINTGYPLIAYCLMGALLAVWQ